MTDSFNPKARFIRMQFLHLSKLSPIKWSGLTKLSLGSGPVRDQSRIPLQFAGPIRLHDGLDNGELVVFVALAQLLFDSNEAL